MWWRKREQAPPPTPAVCRDEADEQGLNEAHAALDEALSQWPEVSQIAEQIRGIRRRNHLAEKALDAMGGHRR
jgi:hypothetical protein